MQVDSRENKINLKKYICSAVKNKRKINKGVRDMLDQT